MHGFEGLSWVTNPDWKKPTYQRPHIYVHFPGTIPLQVTTPPKLQKM